MKMSSPKSTPSTRDQKPKKSGGRPKKTNATNTTGNVVSEKPITQPKTERKYVLTSRGEVFRILYDGRR